MAFLYRPRSYKQPGGPAALDPNNPLTRGIACCLPFTAGFGPIKDIVPGSDARADGGITAWSTGPSGILANSWQFSNATTTDLGFTSGAFSIGVFFNITNISTSSNIISRASYTSESVNDGWVIQLNTGGFASYAVFKNNAAAVYELDSLTAQTLGDHTVIATSDGVNLRQFFWDGIFQASKTGNASPGADSTGAFGCTTAGVSPGYLVVIWNRVLSLQEVQQWHHNPWQILQGGQSAKLAFGSAPAVGTATGTSTAAAIGSSQASAPATDTTVVATGTATDSVIGSSQASAPANGTTVAATGTSTTTGIGSAQARAPATGTTVAATGTSTATGIAGAAGDASATGVATSSVIGSSEDRSVAAATGTESDSYTGSSEDRSVAAATGTESDSYIGSSEDRSVAAATGTESDSYIGSAQDRTVATAIGTSAADANTGFKATATGTSATSFVGASQVNAAAIATASASDSYVGAEQFNGIAMATASATATAVGNSTDRSVATASSIATATATSLLAGSTASATGSAVVVGAASSYFSFFSRANAEAEGIAVVRGRGDRVVRKAPQVLWMSVT